MQVGTGCSYIQLTNWTSTTMIGAETSYIYIYMCIYIIYIYIYIMFVSISKVYAAWRDLINA